MLPKDVDGPILIFGASVFALALGPLVHRWVAGKSRLMSGLDAFVVLAVLGLVLGEVAPLAFISAGYAGLATFVLGVATPYIVDRIFGLSTSHRWTSWVIAGGVLIHAFADGIALSSLGKLSGEGLGLVLALVLHRVPVGLGIWMLMPGQDGKGEGTTRVHARKKAIFLLVAVAVLTGIGQFLGSSALDILGVQTEVFSSFAAGMLVHIVTHSPPTSNQEPLHRWSDRVPALLACLGAVLMWQGLHETSFSHAGHVHHAHPGWMMWVLIPILGMGLQAREPLQEGLWALASFGALILGLSLGPWWGLLAALVLGCLGGRAQRNATSAGLRFEIKPRAGVLRDLAFSGWVGGWIFGLSDHARFGALSEGAGMILVIIAGISLLAMRPSLPLVGFPLLAAMRVAPSWIVLALLAETCARTFHSHSSSFPRRWAIAAVGALLGYFLEDRLREWSFALQELGDPASGVYMAILAALFLWLSATVGVRRWLAGGAFHRHNHAQA